jgi:hypothetical protein
MKGRINKRISVELQMTEEEARWLMTLMQNPIKHYGDSPVSKEDTKTKNFREAIFTTIHKLIGNKY